jgi:hypothetical protein
MRMFILLALAVGIFPACADEPGPDAADTGDVVTAPAPGDVHQILDDRTSIREATERLLLACLSGNREAIFKLIEPTGGSGWVNKRHDRKNRYRYRFWKNMNTPEEVEQAKRFRIDEDERMYRELVALPGRLAIPDSAVVKDVVTRTRPRIVLSEATLILRNDGGEATIVLGPGEASRWMVQYWEVVRDATSYRGGR